MNRFAPEPLPFFVYGTLLPGQPNEKLWGDGITKIEEAFLDDGYIYDMGYYPMLVAQGGGKVIGMLMTVAELAYEEILLRLDALEEYDSAQPDISTYMRVKRKVKTRHGHTKDAWVYEGDIGQVNGASRITGGNWLDYIRNRNREIETWWATIDTMFGHHQGTDG